MQRSLNTEYERSEIITSRREVLASLNGHGLVISEFDSLSLDSLSELLQGVKNIMTSGKESDLSSKRPEDTKTQLSAADKKIVKRLISSSGRVSSLLLSRELDIPLTTTQRRRKRLEEEFIEAHYSLKVGKLGWRKATLFISMSQGDSIVTGKEIFESSDKIISLSRVLGTREADLRAEIVFKNNSDLAGLIDLIKSHPHVQDISWSETLNELGTREYPEAILDSTES
jgi:DNA-binding Lrp family transcriptional regulator